MDKFSIQIRDYNSNDYPDVDYLWQITDLGGKERGDDNDVIEETIKNGGKLIILEKSEDNKIIGTSWITNDKRRLYLHHFCIHPDFQGQGLSKILARESLEFAKKQKLQIKLEVHNTNVKAIDLYKNIGFKYLGDYDVYIIRDVEKCDSFNNI
ncbi:MAG: GNAT family N-acetyltransferase [Bacteroidales bacterium]|nr:GNAT family N-acetyltransferase [Bacteroidales bacterium]